MATDLDLDRLVAETFLAAAEHHAEISSTNDRAREVAGSPNCGATRGLVTPSGPRSAAGSPSLPYLIIAERQTAGRGRGANRWWTGAGSLAFSVLFDAAHMGIARQHSGLVSLAAAAAIVKTVQPRAADRLIGLHWPNDVYVSGRKLAGILVESLSDNRLVVGIGVNVNNSLTTAPPEVRDVAVSLCDLAERSHDRTELLVDLLNQLHEELRTLATEPDAIGLQADELCLQRGDWLTIDTGTETVEGRCFGIQPDGALVLETATGPRKFYAGVLRRS